MNKQNDTVIEFLNYVFALIAKYLRTKNQNCNKYVCAFVVLFIVSYNAIRTKLESVYFLTIDITSHGTKVRKEKAYVHEYSWIVSNL